MAETLELVIIVDNKKGLVSVRNSAGEIKKLGKTTKTVTQKGKKDFDKLWKSMAVGSLVSKGVAAGMRLVRNAVRDVTGEAMNFEDEWANVTTLVTDSTVDMNAMRDEVLGMAGDLGSASELTKGMYQALSAGVEPGKAVKFIGDAARFAKAGLTDMRSSVDVLTTVINAYGLAAEDASMVSDTLFEVIKQGKTTGEELSKSLGLVIPTAAQMGIGLDEVGAAMATMTKFGIDTSIAVTSLNQTMIAIIKPTEDALAAAEKYKIVLSKAGVKKAGGLQAWLADLQARLGDNETAMTRMFPNIRALRATFTLAGKGAKEYSDQLENMQDVVGNTDEAFEKQRKTLRFTTTALKNEFLAVLTKELLPIMKDLREWLNDNRESFGDLFRQIGSGVKTIASIIKILWDFRDVILAVTKALVIMWSVRKAHSFVTKLIEMKSAMGGVTTSAGTLQAAAVAAFIGWKIGRRISEFFKLDNAFAGASDSLINFVGLAHRSTAEMSEAGIKGGALAGAMRNISKSLGDTSRDMATNAATIRANKEAYAALPPELKKLVDGLTKTNEAFIKAEKEEKKRIKTEEARKEAIAVSIELEKQRTAVYLDTIGVIGKYNDKLFETLGAEDETLNAREQAIKVAEEYLKQFPLLDEGFIENIKNSKDTKKEVETLSEAWSDAEARMKLIQTAMNAVTGLLGKMGVSIDKVIPGISDVGSGLLKAFTSKDIFGKITGVAQALGGVFDAVKKFFGGDGIGEAIQRENAWMGMNEELTESLRELAKEVGDTHAATSLMLPDIMDSSDITADNFGDWANRVKEIVLDLERGYISHNQFLETMGSSWTSLVAEAQRLGTEGSAEMLGIIREMEIRGEHITEIQEYIVQQSRQGIKALQGLALSGGTEIAAYSEAFFNSLQKQGLTFMEIINEMGGVLPETYQNFANANADILQKMGQTQEILEALGNTNALTAESFRASQAEAANYYDTMLAGGADEKLVLEAMAPLLSKQLWYAEQYNLELDDRTKALIENARAQGINLEQQIPLEELQRKQAENIEKLVDIMGQFVERLGGAARGFDKLGNSASSAIRKMGAVGSVSLPSAKGKIPEFASGTGGQFIEQDGLFKLHAGELAEVDGDSMRITPKASVPVGGGGGRSLTVQVSAPVQIMNDNRVEMAGAEGDPDERARGFNQMFEDNIDDIEVKMKETIRKVVREEVQGVQ